MALGVTWGCGHFHSSPRIDALQTSCPQRGCMVGPGAWVGVPGRGGWNQAGTQGCHPGRGGGCAGAQRVGPQEKPATVGSPSGLCPLHSPVPREVTVGKGPGGQSPCSSFTGPPVPAGSAGSLKGLVSISGTSPMPTSPKSPTHFQ